MNMHIPDQVAAELDRVLTETLDVKAALTAALSAWVETGMAHVEEDFPGEPEAHKVLVIKTEAP